MDASLSHHIHPGLHSDASLAIIKHRISPLFLFLLCLGTGCLLMLPLAPLYQQIGVRYIYVLLPLIFIWWGIATPWLGYWLFQQFVSCYRGREASPQPAAASPGPVVGHLSLSALQLGYRGSHDMKQRQYYLSLTLALQGEPLEAVAVETGMDEDSIASLILSYNLWGPRVVQTIFPASPREITSYAVQHAEL